MTDSASPLRLAVLSDIHGNLRALQRVASEVAGLAPDLVVNLGDHLSGPLQPAATADFLMTTKWVHLRGNHDRQLTELAPENMGPSDRVAHARLEARHFDWLRSLPPGLTPAPGVLLCHGTPANDLEYLLECVEPFGVRLRSAEEIHSRLDGQAKGMVLCGHSHLPRLIALPGERSVLNPGSVGLQAYGDTKPHLHYIENGSPHARFALLERRGGRWSARCFALEYDWEAAAAEAASAGRDDWAFALRTGYAPRV